MTYVELRTGRRPFAGDPAAVMAAQLAGRADLSGLPAAERPAVARALAIDPADRWPSCRAFVDAIATADGLRRRPARGRRVVVPILIAVAALGPPAYLVIRPGPDSGLPNSSRADETTTSGLSATDPVYREVFRFVGHDGVVAGVALSPDGRRAASAGFDRTVRVWDLGTGREVACLRDHGEAVRRVTFTPDGTRLLSAGGMDFRDSVVRVWDVDSGRVTGRLVGHEHLVVGLVALPDGREAVSASHDGTARVWDLETGAEVRRFAGLDRADVSPAGWPRQAWSLAVSADGRRALVGLRDGTARVFDTGTGAEVDRLSGHVRPVNAVAFTNVGGYVTGAGTTFPTGDPSENRLTFRGQTGEPIGSLPGPGLGVRELAAAADATTALAVGRGEECWLIDARTRTVRQRLTGHAGEVWSAAVSADRSTLVTGGSDGTVRVWKSADDHEN